MIPTDTEVKRKNETAEEEVQPGDTEVVPPPHRILRFPPLPLPEGQQQEYRSVKSKADDRRWTKKRKENQDIGPTPKTLWASFLCPLRHARLQVLSRTKLHRLCLLHPVHRTLLVLQRLLLWKVSWS